MPSFDTVLEPNMVEVKNAVEQTPREIETHFDFKGTSAAVSLSGQAITVLADSDFQLQQALDVLRTQLTKRGVDVRFLEEGRVEKIGGDELRQVLTVRSGIASDDAKTIQQLIKGSKLKRQAAIQGDAVRVSGAQKDDLQAAIALIRQTMAQLPLQFTYFRD